MVSTVRNAGNLYGLGLQVHDQSSDGSIASLKTWIDGGRPALALIDYGPIVKAKYHESVIQGGHFVLVVGYDDDDVFVHDPYWNGTGGQYRQWKINVFDDSWYTPGTQYQRMALVPAKAIAQSRTPAYPIPADINKRIRAKALFEGSAVPKISNEQEYKTALAWLGTWGTDTRTYSIAVGDTLGLVSTKFYGSAQYFPAIAAFNGLADVNAVAAGQQIVIPMPTVTPAPNGGPKVYNFTNQQVINAFHEVFAERGLPDQFWSAVQSAGIANIADNRAARYNGPDINDLPNLSAEMKASILMKLSA
jgi:hypothetical protein